MDPNTNKPWTEVTARIQRHEDITGIEAWCLDNCTGKYKIYAVTRTGIHRVRFESVDDAIMFSLKWS